MILGEEMTPNKKIKFYFYQIEINDGTVNLRDLLEEIQNLPLDNRIIDVLGTPRMLERDFTATHSSYKAYLFTTKRTKCFPRKIKADGRRESLNITDGDGLGEDVAVAINSTGKIAAIQSNQYSMKPSTIATYINKIYSNININFLPIIKFNSLDRIIHAQCIKKFHLKFAGSVNFEKLCSYGLSAADALAFQQFFAAPYIDLQWSVGRKSERLGEWVYSWITAFKKYFDNSETKDITTLTANIIEGDGDDGHNVFIDLLADKIQCEVDIPMNMYNEIDENILLETACHVLEDNYNEYSDFIEN